jgi:hypothetical protein
MCQQSELLELGRSSCYYEPATKTAENLSPISYRRGGPELCRPLRHGTRRDELLERRVQADLVERRYSLNSFVNTSRR